MHRSGLGGFDLRRREHRLRRLLVMLPDIHSLQISAASTGVLQADIRFRASRPVSKASWRRFIQFDE
jgi:hypothetical protein